MATPQNSQQSNNRNHKQNFQSTQQGQSSQSQFPFEAIGTALTTELVNNFAPPIIEEIIEVLTERFGDEKVGKWTSLLGMNQKSGNAEGAFFNVLRAAVPGLPQDFDIKNLTEWEPIKTRIAKNPIASAAAVAVGVGLLFAARELLNQEAGAFTSDTKSKVKKVIKSKARTH